MRNRESATFGQMLRSYRQRAGLTQEQLAAAIGATFTYVSKLEHDKVERPSPEKLERAAEAMKLSEEEQRELFRLADTIPTGMESWILQEPTAFQLYRSIQSHPEAEQEELIRRLIRVVEEEREKKGRDENPGGAE